MHCYPRRDLQHAVAVPVVHELGQQHVRGRAPGRRSGPLRLGEQNPMYKGQVRFTRKQNLTRGDLTPIYGFSSAQPLYVGSGRRICPNSKSQSRAIYRPPPRSPATPALSYVLSLPKGLSKGHRRAALARQVFHRILATLK